jgi:hypothetical protein
VMLDRKKALLLTMVLLLALVAVVRVVGGRGDGGPLPGTARSVYYYDLNTGELFVADAGLIPPIDAPSGVLRGTQDGKAGVMAYVFTCGSCSPQDRYVAWIETYTPKARRALAEQSSTKQHPLADRQGSAAVSSLVAEVNPTDPGDVKWMDLKSQQGSSIVRQATRPCPDKSAPKPCLPGNK